MALLDSGSGGDDGGTTTSDPPESSPRFGGGSSSSSSSGGGFQLPDVLATFAANPRGFVLAIVATWVVGGILYLGRFVLDVILQVGDILLIIPNTIRDVVVSVGAVIGAPFLGFASQIDAAVVELANSLGPLAPIVIPAIYIPVAIGLVRLGAWIADLIEIPFLDLGAILGGLTAVPRAIWRVLRG